MSYGAGYLSERVKVLHKKEATMGAYGRNSSGVKWEEVGDIWANVSFTRGMKAMREGALDAYDTVMVRSRWYHWLTRDSMLVIDGRCFSISSYNADRRGNIVQIVAKELSEGVEYDKK